MATDRPRGVPGEALALLIGRVLIVAIFLQHGYEKLVGFGQLAGYLTGHGAPAAAHPLAVLTAVVEFFGALCVLVGFQTRCAALLMAVFTLVATLIGHRFWEETNPGAAHGQAIYFMKNLAIVGGFLFLYVAGPGAWSVDRRGR
jgi:putative oxidoreductase